MANKPRLLFLVPALKDTPETGGELYNLRLAQGLGESWDVTVATFEELPGFQREARAYRASVQAFLAERPPFDVVLQDTYVYPFAQAANQWLSAQTRLIGFGQAVYSERHRRPWTRIMEDRRMASSMRPYHGLIVVSEAMKAHAKGLGIAESRVGVVSPGYDLPPADAPGSLVEPYRFVGAGSYQPSKGQVIVVDGFAKLLARRPDLRGRIRLDLYGNLGYAPDYVERIQEIVAIAGVEDSIGLHGPIPQGELWQEFARSHAFVFLASGEGVGMVTVEAMSLGCAPVLSDDDLSRELIGSEDSGVLTPRSSASLADALERLIDDPQRWQATREAAQALARSRIHSWDEVVHRFSNELRRVAQL